MKTILVITGQTASGKTNYARKIAQQYNGQLINCDSRQIYKKLNIVTGKDIGKTDGIFHLEKKVEDFDIGYYIFKPTTSNRQPRPKADQPMAETTDIWLYDIVDPKQYFSAHYYKILCRQTINKIIKNGKTPIIVGGTYFYLQEVLYDRLQQKIAPDWKQRHEFAVKTVAELQMILKKISHNLFENLNQSDRNNPHRLIRAIELAKSNPNYVPKKPSYQYSPFFEKLQIKMVGLIFSNKDDLKTQIQKRVGERLKSGAVDEVEKLIKKGYNENDPGLQTIGYKQIIAYLQKQLSYEAMQAEWLNREIQYAKRQLTFMKSDPNILWNSV